MSELDEYDEILLEIVCRGACKFYKQGQEEDEEDFRCGAYIIFKKMLKEGNITRDELEKTYRNIVKKDSSS